MGNRKDLSNFDKRQNVMTRRQLPCISKMTPKRSLIGCSQYAVISTYQNWFIEWQLVNWQQGHGSPKLSDAHGIRKPFGKKAIHKRHRDTLGNARVGKLGSWHSYECYFNKHHVTQHCCRPLHVHPFAQQYPLMAVAYFKRILFS